MCLRCRCRTYGDYVWGVADYFPYTKMMRDMNDEKKVGYTMINFLK
jgi:hypothetical protein